MTNIRSMNDFHKRLCDADDKIVVLDFYATWCGPCKDIEKLVKSLARQYASKAIVLKINVDKYDELVEKYKVRNMPTFVFLKGNRSMGKVIGADDHKLTHMMAKHCK
ncbi:thioredoxin-1 [Drosophila grimshawi]|uniref:Thioredoxin n=1 Tax=Drosophila grimshawi TaxID=7222 RepID=B4JMA7_DROGR|nr:thioredoxin-1 [Drosophila grimshawi]EDV91868.1 GH24609 [Drosophila grimshawi]